MAQHRDWFGLMIGNSRLHWAYFQGEHLVKAWDSPHLSDTQDILKAHPPNFLDSETEILTVDSHTPLYLASVVPSQTLLWQQRPQTTVCTLEQIPLHHLYSTLGCDRALAALGAGEKYGFPVLVIDGGTALTLTGINNARSLVGGAILPGLSLQFQSLAQKTAQLSAIALPEILPNRWAMNTKEAIASGILYTILDSLQSFITDWQSQFSQSSIIFTGGDGSQLLTYLKQYNDQSFHNHFLDPHLIFWGMQVLVFS